MDPILIGLVLLMAASWAWAGVAICTMRHQQRGQEVDDWDIVFTPSSPDSWKVVSKTGPIA